MLTSQSKNQNEPKLVMPKNQDLSRSLEIKVIWTFDAEFPTIFNETCTYITLKSAVKDRQLRYYYPHGKPLLNFNKSLIKDT